MIPPSNPAGRQPLFSRYIPTAIAALYLVFAIASVQYDDITFDEGTHLHYGIEILKGKADRYRDGIAAFPSTMPVTALNALPRAAEQVFHPGTKKNDWGAADTKSGRYITIFTTLVLLLYCFRFSAMLSSERTGCIVMLLVAADPNILAHARLVTTDVYAATGFIATLYHLWRWLVQKEARHFYYWCIAIALAQVCKANNILLYPASFIPMIFFLFRRPGQFRLRTALWQGLAFVAIQIFIINMCFLFSGPWTSLSALHVKSAFFQSLQPGWLARIPIPLPKAYIDTFDLIQYERETFEGDPLTYLNGVLRDKQGFWNYYLVCYALKTPLLSMLISTAGFIYCCAVKKIRAASLLQGWLPGGLVLLFLSSSSIQSGYRYLLPVVCLSLIFSAYCLDAALRRFPRLAFTGLALIPVLTAVLAFPNYLVYTNPLVHDKK
ncbi:MAG TPA: glycosyltransferase family 39 protein, partial [Chitinophagaceae bacterium]|nr:glycosyltransferase family 39 protein [Chitinophagaceae bacterium]